MSTVLVFIVGGLLTYLMRLSFIYLIGRGTLPEPVRRMLRFVPAAVLSAIIAPEVLLHAGTPDPDMENARLLAAALAVVVAWRTKNTLITILVGFGIILGLQLLF